MQRAQVCLWLAKGEVTSEEVIKVYNLDTQRKQRDFALMCRMMELGWNVSENARKNRI